MLGVFFLFFSAGCGKDKDGSISLKIQKSDTGTAVGEAPNIYPDAFLDPSEVRIGLKSAKLIRADETTPSYTIFDTLDAEYPYRLDLRTLPELVDTNKIPLGCPCLYSKIQFEIIFVDTVVSTFIGTSETKRRFRFYTGDHTDPLLLYPVKAGELLVGDNSEDFNKFNFQWIDLANGNFIPLSGTPPDPLLFNLLRVSPARFPDNIYSSTVTVDLIKYLDIPEGADDQSFTITATFEVKNLFFYDDTDGNGQFDLNSDGLLDAKTPEGSRYSSTFPRITASTN